MRPGYKRTEIGLIPEQWGVEALGRSCQLVTKGTTPTSIGRSFTRDGVAFLKAESISESGSTIPEKVAHIDAPTHAVLKRSQLKSSDVLISIAGVLGRVGLVDESDLPANINQALAIIRLGRSTKFDRGFLFHALRSTSVSRQIRDINVRAAQANISLQDVRELLLPVPPAAEQRAIATALRDVDALLGKLDRLIAKKRDLKQAVMQQLPTGQTRLSGFSGEWAMKSLGELGVIAGAGVDKKIRPGEPPVRLVNYMDVYRRTFIRSADLEHTVSAPPEQAARCAVRKGDIFFTPSSEMPYDIAASAVAVEDIPDACYSYHVVRLRLAEDWDLNFRAYAFTTQVFLDQAARMSEGSGVRYVITQGKFRQLAIRYPSDKREQTAIAAVLSDMDAEIAALEARRGKTRDLKQAMMQELLMGRTRLV